MYFGVLENPLGYNHLRGWLRHYSADLQQAKPSGAFGWDGGFGCSWLVDPNYDLAIIVLTQRFFETSEAPKVHRDIQAAAYAALAAP